ncbi:MAG: hypothetical protein ACSHWW_10140 [Nonlabens sp.]|uniref:hypothetical protein n=1 Tax=Nonlabens sp. TaxID=1888209 RepID=UPI003EF371F4
MKTRSLFLSLLFSTLFITVNAQSLGEFKEQYAGQRSKKLKDSQKKIYIAQFKTNYEVYKDASSYKAKGMFGGGNAKAKLALALDSINPLDLQNMTNELFIDFKDQLIAQGFEIVTADAASKADSYADYQRMEGGELIPTDVPGFVSVTPVGHSYFVKGLDKNGVEKKKYSLVGDPDLKMNKKVAKDLGNIIVAKVDLFLMFSDQKQGWSPGGAKVKIKTNLRMVGATTVTAEKKKGLRFKGAYTSHPIKSSISFIDQKGNYFEGTLKKPLEVNGVLEKETIKVSQSNGIYKGTTSFSYATPDMETTKRSYQTVKVDPSQYAQGAKMAMKKFMKFHVNAFVWNANGGK